tara:strand:+ start:226 stop:546 length:321 start_codon:yes stop_codon:yes gene_type:complete
MKKHTKEQLDDMSDEELFKLLDERSKELNECSRPLGRYHTKLYTATSDAISGNEFDIDKINKASEIGAENDKKVNDKIIDTMFKNDLKEPNLNVKNIKTHRSQWFD